MWPGRRSRGTEEEKEEGKEGKREEKEEGRKRKRERERETTWSVTLRQRERAAYLALDPLYALALLQEAF